MKKTCLILTALITIVFLFTSCQKAKEPEKKGAVQETQKEEVKQAETKPSETKPSETKPEVQPQPEEQPPTKIEVKEEKKEKPEAAKPSPLTEEEQSEFEKLKKKWLSRKFTKEDALKALRILVKADLDRRSIRWYHKSGGLESGASEPVDDVCDLLAMAAKTKKKEAFDLAIYVLKDDNSYMTVCAAREIRLFNNKEAIPYLRKYLNFTPHAEQLTTVLRLEAAGSLLALGDADTALPVLDELAKNGATTALGNIFHTMRGKEWEKKGLEIIKKAYNYEIKDNKKALETKVLAALFLIRLNVEDRTSIENSLITIAREILAKKQWPISSYGYSDHRTLETIIIAFKELKDKKTIPILEGIAKHPDASYLVRWANEAIESLSKENWGRK